MALRSQRPVVLPSHLIPRTRVRWGMAAGYLAFLVVSIVFGAAVVADDLRLAGSAATAAYVIGLLLLAGRKR